MVPHVEEFRTELQVAAPRFAKEEILEQRQVPVVIPGTTKCIVAQVSPKCRGLVQQMKTY